MPSSCAQWTPRSSDSKVTASDYDDDERLLTPGFLRRPDQNRRLRDIEPPTWCMVVQMLSTE